MKTLIEKQRMLKSMVETMSNFKNDKSEKGVRLYESKKIDCQNLISELRSVGVNESTHPIFANSVSSFNYWK